MSELIVRCSSIGRLMAKPENADLDAEYLTPEVLAIIGKTKRSDEERSVLEDVRRKSLSAGGKTHVRELVRESVYGFEPADIETRPILKGRQLEEDGIAMLARLTGRPLVKNKERRTNGLLSGEADVFDAPIGLGSDAKLPYSMANMPIVLADCYDSGYEYQMRGYMSEGLWDCERWSVDYLLLSTPEDLIGYEPAALHFVDHIPERLRWTRWMVQRDRAIEALIVDKVLAARRYYREVLNEFDRTHRLADEPEQPATQQPTPAPAPAPAQQAVSPADLPDLALF
jgi:hypothetical protein